MKGMLAVCLSQREGHCFVLHRVDFLFLCHEGSGWGSMSPLRIPCSQWPHLSLVETDRNWGERQTSAAHLAPRWRWGPGFVRGTLYSYHCLVPWYIFNRKGKYESWYLKASCQHLAEIPMTTYGSRRLVQWGGSPGWVLSTCPHRTQRPLCQQKAAFTSQFSQMHFLSLPSDMQI